MDIIKIRRWQYRAQLAEEIVAEAGEFLRDALEETKGDAEALVDRARALLKKIEDPTRRGTIADPEEALAQLRNTRHLGPSARVQAAAGPPPVQLAVSGGTGARGAVTAHAQAQPSTGPRVTVGGGASDASVRVTVHEPEPPAPPAAAAGPEPHADTVPLTELLAASGKPDDSTP